MTTRSRPTPIRLLVGLAAALALALGLPAAPAGAHEGKAVLAIEAAHPAGMSVHYIVRVTWEDDGHPAADATVTATAVGPDGAQLTPVTLAPADADGRYAGVVDYPSPGAWTVRITSIDPTGSIEQSQEVVAATTGDDAADDATASDEGGFAPADDGTGASSGQAADNSSDDSGTPVVLILVAAAVVVIGAVTAVNIIRRNRPGSHAGTGTGGTSAGDGTGDGPTAGGASADDGTGDEPRAGGASAGSRAGDGAEAEAGADS